MKTNRLVFLGILAATLIAASCSSPLVPSISSSGQTAADPGTQKAVPYAFYTPTSESALLSADIAAEGYLILRADESFDPVFLARKGAEIVGSIQKGEITWYRVKAPGKVVSLIKTLQNVPGVAYAEPDYRYEYDGGFSLPDDPYVASAEYSVYITRLEEAWATFGFGNYTPYVAAIDTGLNPQHEEFAGRVVRLMSVFESTDGGVTNNYVGDYVDPVEVPLNENWDDGAHGSHVMGTIAANGDNGAGVAGVCWQSNLISYKVFSETDDASGTSWAVYGSLYDLINWKVDQGIDYTIPVNMSLGGDYASYFAIDMINYGLEENVLVIASMGNDGQEVMQYPAGYAGVIAVGATNGRDDLVLFSNTGYHNSVTAPGFDIISAGSVGGDTASRYEWMSGTSMATPFVTGLVTYMLTFDPYLTPGQIKTMLEQSAYDLGEAGYDPRFGYGRVDALATIGNAQYAATQTSDYSDKVIAVQVRNIAQAYDSGVPGYESAVPNQTVYLYDARDRFVRLTKTNDYGYAIFPMLPPGNYRVSTAYYGHQKQRMFYNFGWSDMVDTTTFNFDVALYNIQTIPNTAYNGGADATDTIIDIYDESGNHIANYDYDYLDSYSLVLESGHDYYIRITAYASRGGNYGLYITSSSPNGFINATDPYRSGTTDFAEPNDTIGTAYTVSQDTAYPLYLVGTEADWFVFSVP